MGRTAHGSVLAMQPAWAGQRLGCSPHAACRAAPGPSLTLSAGAYSACLLLDLYERRWRVVHMNAGATHLLGCEWEGGGMDVHSPAKDSATCQPRHGMLLQQLFKLQHHGAEWQASRWRFTLRSVPGAAGTAAMDDCFDLHFSAATSHDLDTRQLLDMHGCAPQPCPASDSGLFVVHVHKSAAAPARAPVCFPDPLRSAFSGIKGGYAAAVAAAFMPRSTVATPIEGLVVGPLMGRGSSGHVHRGVYKGSPVAVKIIDDFTSVRCNGVGQPLEAALASGQHDGLLRAICCTFGASCHSHSRSSYPACWMLFDFCDKGCLADAIKKGWFIDSGSGKHSSTTLRTVATTALEVASAMAHLHAHGVTHGDLSGGNILLHTSASNPHGFSAKVSDFGLCCSSASKALPSHCSRRTGSPSSMCGTITHVAPEVLLADGAAPTPAADVYAFGVLLWEMLSGHAAWAGLRAAQVVFQTVVLKQGLPMLPGLPAALSSLLSCCLAQQAEDRCSFEGAAGLLRQYLDDSQASAAG